MATDQVEDLTSPESVSVGDKDQVEKGLNGQGRAYGLNTEWLVGNQSLV